MSRKETAIQRAILDYLKLLRIFAWRVNNIPAHRRVFHGMYGVPDIIGVLPNGRFLGIEVKSEKGELTEHQVKFRTTCESNNGLYIVARSVQEVIEGMKGEGI